VEVTASKYRTKTVSSGENQRDTWIESDETPSASSFQAFCSSFLSCTEITYCLDQLTFFPLIFSHHWIAPKDDRLIQGLNLSSWEVELYDSLPIPT